MKRWLQARLLIVLAALVLVPAATLPFSERLRDEWARLWEPKPVLKEVPAVEPPFVILRPVKVVPEGAFDRVWRRAKRPDPATAAPSSPLRFSEAQELGEMAGSVRSVDLPMRMPE